MNGQKSLSEEKTCPPKCARPLGQRFPLCFTADSGSKTHSTWNSHWKVDLVNRGSVSAVPCPTAGCGRREHPCCSGAGQVKPRRCKPAPDEPEGQPPTGQSQPCANIIQPTSNLENSKNRLKSQNSPKSKQTLFLLLFGECLLFTSPGAVLSVKNIYVTDSPSTPHPHRCPSLQGGESGVLQQRFPLGLELLGQLPQLLETRTFQDRNPVLEWEGGEE